MAERRMFSKTIIDSDAFLDMPQSSQLLYFHLSMRADDDGFINNPKNIMRQVGAKDDDLKILAAKKFILPFESGVVVIKHWKIHNYIQNDRKHATKYKRELSDLELDENKAYRKRQKKQLLTSNQVGNDVSNLDTECIQVVSNLDTEVRLGKVRLGKEEYNTPREENFFDDDQFDDLPQDQNQPELETETFTDSTPAPKAPRFQKPTITEIQAYCRERGNQVNAEKFHAHYESNGWKVGREPMKNWKAAVVTWEHTNYSSTPGTKPLRIHTQSTMLEMDES